MGSALASKGREWGRFMVVDHMFWHGKLDTVRLLALTGLFVALAVSPARAFGFNFSASPLAGYEVLSYRDSPTQLTGGAVESGDAFEQTSFTGVQAGLTSTIGVLELNQIEPIVSVDLLMSRLAKSAESEGIKSTGTFNFTQAALGLGARYWLASSFSTALQLSFATSLKNTMSTTKTQVKDSANLGTVDFEVSSHKKTSLVLGAQWLPLGSGLSLGADVRLGSGCFDCKSTSTALQHRAYLTRSVAVTAGWLLGKESEPPPPPPTFRAPPGGQRNLKNIKRQPQQQKKNNNELMGNEGMPSE